MDGRTNYTKGIFYLLLCLSIIAVGAVLKITAEVVLPVTVAIFLALVFHPVPSTQSSGYRRRWASPSCSSSSLW